MAARQRIFALVVTALMCGSVVKAAKWPEQANLSRVLIYCELEHSVQIDGVVLMRAQTRASQLLAAAGLRLEWHSGKAEEAEPAGQVIGIKFVPDALEYGARDRSTLATAAPYATGTTILVFDDRVKEYFRLWGEMDGAKVLGHVLAHEIVHILQGVARHSESGLMKAQWSAPDFSFIRGPGLSLAPEDRELLRLLLMPHQRTMSTIRSSAAASLAGRASQ